jgi:pimeloyl-ACP methyl ester carboxylesterase
MVHTMSPLVAALLVTLAATPRPPPVGEKHIVRRDGMNLSVWEKRPGSADAHYRPDDTKVVLLLHGATWSGRPDFDLQIRDYSLMDALAQAGYDTFALDVHGYGESDPPVSPDDYVTADQAEKDVQAAVQYIQTIRKVKQLNLFGWSWGAHIAGLYATHHPENLVRLLLDGLFPYKSNEPMPKKLPDDHWRVTSFDMTQTDFIDGEFEDDVAKLFGDEALAAVPKRPTGIGLDFGYRMPLFDPLDIHVATLMIFGVYDVQPPKKRAYMPPDEYAKIEGRCLEFFGQLGTFDRRYLLIPNGGHAVHLEKGHKVFQQALIHYLGEGRPVNTRPFPAPKKN